MPAKKTATKDTQKSTRNRTAATRATTGFTQGERDAIRARAQELKAPRAGKADGERAALEAIAKMPVPYRTLGERLHAIIKASAPVLSPKTWYGLPAYSKDGKVVCYLRMNPKAPYNDRYMTFGFNETANLDEGAMWPIAFAVKELTAEDEARIGELVRRAVS
jgi:uncharacterized protein YdhG (YjbR/CyaY superfamily)